MTNYWLLKSEPETFGIEHLKAMPNQTEHWDGVRNYQARNLMRDDMRKGDKVLFYHSSCKVPGVAGIAEVVREAYPDFTAFDPDSPYFDPKSTQEKPRWFMVDVQWKASFPSILPLQELRQRPELQGMKLLQKGQRLSVQPVTEPEFKLIATLGHQLSNAK